MIYKKIKIKNGYVRCPKDWIVLKNYNPLECEHVSMIAAKHAIEYNIPFFIFFEKNLSMNYDEEFMDKIFAMCREEFPYWYLVERFQVKPEIVEGNIQNYDNWERSPEIIVVSLPDIDSNSNPPYGAGIIRKQYEK